ncbi:MAG: DNA translocase FtsK 4TM domain-containing protein [Xanthobacteraceae bacterium]
MYALRRTVDVVGLVSDDLRGVIGRRVRQCGGFVLVALAVALGLALATWSVRDPSFSHATSSPVRNLLGFPGAIAADLLMQLFGIAAVAVVLPVAIWGCRLVVHREFDRERMRLALWLVGAVLAAAFASCLPTSPRWPLPTGLGGVIGDAVLRFPAMLVGAPLWGIGRLASAVLTGAAAIAALAFACGLGARSPAEKDDEVAPERTGWFEGGFVLVGLVYHGILSLKARISRFLFWWASWLPAGSTRRARVEPRVGDPASSVESETEEKGEEEDEEEPVQRTARRASRPRPRPSRKSDDYELPQLSLLAAPKASERYAPNQAAIKETGTALEGVLQDFGVRGEIINAHPGPVVTLYELEPAPGIKTSRVIGLADDIARSMSALSARVAVVPGRNAIGIELPNPKREKVYLRELLASEDYADTAAKLPLCLGKTIGGDPVIVDLTRMPHLLIAGTTGSGKSVAINTMILSLVYRLKPENCRLIMVDPKMLELSVYDSIPHLLTPVVTDPKKAVVALKWAVREMEDRYKKMAKLGVRNIDGYNARLAEAAERDETLTRTVHTGYDKETGEAIYEEEQLELEPLAYVVVIVDEMADLMMVAGKDIEGAIQRLAQMARAAGIHVILATQRPSVDVITGTIKANFPTRISFQVTSKIDSRTILGEQGAEQLLGQGDMLYMAGGGRISRVHGPFVSDGEVEKIVHHLKAQGAPQYLEAVTAGGEEEGEDGAVFDATAMGAEDSAGDLYSQAVQIVLRDRKASTSYIQRRLQIGYNRAASIMERMEQEGVVGQANHAGKREILMGGDDD